MEKWKSSLEIQCEKIDSKLRIYAKTIFGIHRIKFRDKNASNLSVAMVSQSCEL